MLSIFRSRKSKYSRGRGRSYYERENMVHTLNDLASINSPVSEQQYSTTELIKFKGLTLNEIDEINVLKVFGKPKHIISGLVDLKNYKVIFYRHALEKFVLLIQFHCFQHNFLFASNMVTSAGILSTLDKELFLNRIVNKYFPELKLNLEQGFDIKITDKLNNFIKVVDEVNFRINYVNSYAFNQLLSVNSMFSKKAIKENLDTKIYDYF